jgi:hypothetical protein
MDCECCTDPLRPPYADREGKALINFGVSIGHIPVRMKVMNDPGTFLHLTFLVSFLHTLTVLSIKPKEA